MRAATPSRPKMFATTKTSSVDIPKTTTAIVAPKTLAIGTWAIVRYAPIGIKATVATRLGSVVCVAALISVIHPTVFAEVLAQLLTLGIGSSVVSQSTAVLCQPLRVGSPIGDICPAVV